MTNADFRMTSSLEATTKSLCAADHELFWTRYFAYKSYSRYGLHSKQSLRCFAASHFTVSSKFGSGEYGRGREEAS